jgi:antitoxin YefM
MKAVTFRKAQEDLEGLFDTVANSGEPVVVRRRGRRPVVVISKSEYRGLMETMHLLSTRANAIRLLTAAEDVQRGNNLVEHDLIG